MKPLSEGAQGGAHAGTHGAQTPAHQGAQGAHGGRPLSRPRLTINEAATATGKSRSTIQRMRDSGSFPQAKKEDGTWRIPVDDLLAAGHSASRSRTAEGA